MARVKDPILSRSMPNHNVKYGLNIAKSCQMKKKDGPNPNGSKSPPVLMLQKEKAPDPVFRGRGNTGMGRVGGAAGACVGWPFLEPKDPPFHGRPPKKEFGLILHPSTDNRYGPVGIRKSPFPPIAAQNKISGNSFFRVAPKRGVSGPQNGYPA